MDYAAEFAALARRGQHLLDYTLQFCHLAIRSPFEDETIKSLYWIGANYEHQVDLPDLQELSWRDVRVGLSRWSASANAMRSGCAHHHTGA